MLYIASDCDFCHHGKSRRAYHRQPLAIRKQRHELSRRAHARARELVRQSKSTSRIAGVIDVGWLALEYQEWMKDDKGRHEPDPLEMRDAFWECKHGRLAHDAWRDPECSCWKVPAPQGQPRSRIMVGDD